MRYGIHRAAAQLLSTTQNRSNLTMNRQRSNESVDDENLNVTHQSSSCNFGHFFFVAPEKKEIKRRLPMTYSLLLEY